MLKANAARLGGHNILYFDLPLLKRAGLLNNFGGTILDSHPIAKLNDENRGLGLKDLSKQYFRAVNYTPYWGDSEAEAWHSRWNEWPSMSEQEKQERTNYAGKDAWLGIQVLQKEVERLKRKPHLVRAYKSIILPQARAIEEMNRNGLPVNLERAKEMSAKLEAEAEEIAERIHALIPQEFLPRNKGSLPGFESLQKMNLNSSEQVATLLDKVGLPRIKPTPGGDRASADRFVLLKLLGLPRSKYPAWVFEFISGVLDIRDRIKRKGFLDGAKGKGGIIRGVENSYDGRLHSLFKIGPISWRPAAEEPNCLQWDSEIKSLVEAPDGWVLLKLDESALELRGMADDAPEPKLIRRFKDGRDLHWEHTRRFLNLLEGASKDKDKRRAIKTLSFSGSYGAGAGTAADQIRNDFRDLGIGPEVILSILEARGIDPEEDMYFTLARDWMKWWRSEYPAIRKRFFQVADSARRDGYVRSKFGFEWRPLDLHAEDERIRGAADRKAYNIRIQNLSVITWLAYRELEPVRRDMGLDNDVFLLVDEHDSLLWLCKENVADLWGPIAAEAMTQIDWQEFGASFSVPLEVEWGVSQTWG